jgi:ribosome-associated protein
VKKSRRSSLKTKRKAKGDKVSLKGGQSRGPRQAAGRIPVRGSRKSAKTGKTGKSDSALGSRVKSRSATQAAEPRSARASADLAETRALAVVAMEAAMDKRGLEPVLIDVSSMGSYTDFIGIISGRSDRQVDAISDHVCQELKARGRHVLGQEGTGNGRWTLLDFGAFVIHVFYHPVREFYDLESLWIEAPRVKLDVPPEAILQQPDALYGAL